MLRYAEDVQRGETVDVKKACNELNAHLTLRTFVAGQTLSVADLLLWQMLKGAAQWKQQLHSVFPHVARWFTHCEHCCTAALGAIASQGEAKQQLHAGKGKTKGKSDASGKANDGGKGKGSSEGGSFDIKLPGAEMGKVRKLVVLNILRFYITCRFPTHRDRALSNLDHWPFTRHKAEGVCGPSCYSCQLTGSLIPRS